MIDLPSFRPSHRNSGGKAAPGRRALGFESLESREMLSVSPLTYPVTSAVTTEYDYRASDWFEQITENQTYEPETEGFVENEWIVQLTDDALSTLYSVSVAAAYLDDYGISVLGGLGSSGTLHVSMKGETSEYQSTILAGLDCVEFFEQNYACLNTASVSDVVNDPDAYRQWYLDTIDVLPAWEQTKGEGVIVAVIDSGIQLDHPDLQANIWVNPGETAGDGKDDDGNGFIDDINGWDFNENIANVSDSYGHGTKVSGVIGMIGNNNTSGIGVAPDVQIMPLKVGDQYYTSTSVIAGIHYAVNLKTEFDINICAINASFGGMRNSIVLVSAIEKALDAGIVIVASAGNDATNNDLSVNYNNRYDNLIVVAATDASDNLSSFSNYGAKSVDLAAPGSSIFTTIGMGTTSVNGTSFAAPMVTAAVALLASAHPDWSAGMIKEAILATVDVLPSLEGKVASGGRLNIGDAINYDAAKKPDAPSDLSVLLQADGSFELKWSDNSKNETSFELQYRRDGGAWTTAYSTISRNTQSTNFVSSLAGTYDFRIRAVHSFSESDWSNTASVVKDNTSPPPSPTGLMTSMVTDGLNAYWNTVSGATAYRLERSLSGLNQWSVVYEGSDNSFSDTGVGSGVRYDYRVYAICDGIASAASAVRSQDAPYRIPATPSGVTVTQLNADTVQFIWSDVPYADSYLIERYDTAKKKWVEAATTKVATFTDTKLKASTQYSYRITAKNIHSSEPTETITVTTLPPVCKAPTSLKATVKDFTSVTFIWKAAAGATAYRVEMSMTGKNDSWETVSSTSSTNMTVDGLTAKTKYYFRVYAVSDSGESKASSKLTVTTKAVPLAKITTSGYAISSTFDFGVQIRITTPQQNDNKKNPVLPAQTTVSYEIIVAGDKAKTDKTTGLLIDGMNLGSVTFTETAVKNKPYSDSSLILFSDIARIGDLTKMKNVQIQLLTTYTLPDGTTIMNIPTKVAKLTLPKWFA